MTTRRASPANGPVCGTWLRHASERTETRLLAVPVNAGIVPEHEVHQARQAVKEPHRARRILERDVDDLLHRGLVDDRPVPPAAFRDRIVVRRTGRAVAVVVGGNGTKARVDAAAEHHAALPIERRPGFRLQRRDLRRDAGDRASKGTRRAR